MKTAAEIDNISVSLKKEIIQKPPTWASCITETIEFHYIIPG